MISVRNLTRKYGSFVAVNDVSLDIEKGEIVGLLGHNGAGKTTIMKVLTGFIEPTQGIVTVGGNDVVDARQDVQRMIGYMPESAPLYYEMLVQDYLMMMAELRGIPAAERQRAVADAVVATGLQERLTQPIGTLSKGFKQRVGLAQAIVHKPEVLILDEPTNGLDPTQILSIRNLILSLGKSSTIILSTHILQEIEAVCDRVLILIDGELVEDASLNDLLSTRNVQVALAEGTTGVAEELGEITGVTGIRKAGAHPDHPGFDLWIVETSAEVAPIPKIIDAAVKKGWIIGSVAREQRTLQRVFTELQSKAAQETAA